MITAQHLDRMARDLERRLGALCSVARNTRCGSMRTNQARAVEDALDFFAGARAAAHAECIERLASADVDAAMDRADAGHLVALYREAAKDHAIVDTLGRRWLEHGILEPSEALEMRATLEHLQNVYARLITREERSFYRAIEATPVTPMVQGASAEDG